MGETGRFSTHEWISIRIAIRYTRARACVCVCVYTTTTIYIYIYIYTYTVHRVVLSVVAFTSSIILLVSDVTNHMIAESYGPKNPLHPGPAKNLDSCLSC